MGLCVKFLKENHTLFKSHVLGFTISATGSSLRFFPDVGVGGGGGEGICFGADCQMWKSPGVGTRVLEIGLRSNFRFQPVTVQTDKLLVTVNFSFLFCQGE